jgi:glycerate kinase
VRSRVVIAPDSFKGSVSARAAAEALAAGLRDAWGDVDELILVPIADGGEGTVDVFVAAGAAERRARVHGPLGETVDATYALRADRAILEMAAASGLTLTARPRVWDATTAGTGELIRDALDAGARHIILGIGGSATNDGGAGALAALGVQFLDAAGTPLEPSPAGLTALATIHASGLDPRLRATRIDVACDVTNPLLGPHGATAVFAPQKGAHTGDLTALEAVLARFAAAAVAATGRDLRELPGSGAAGGLGYGLATFLGARLAPGFPLVAEACGLADALRGAAWCLTGEGRIDAQTPAGKVVAGVAALARPAGVRVCAFGGSVDLRAEIALAADGVVCLPIVTGPMPLAAAIADAPALIRAAATRFARLVRPA